MFWTSFKDNISGFYYFLWNTSPTETESENETDNSQSGVIQMEKVEIQNADKNHIEKLEFIVSKEFNKDISKEQLINVIKTEIQYINKKMSMVKGVGQINVEDIVSKTHLIDLLNEVADDKCYIEELFH
tara:strand:+ start:105 stop:491 length:387 start_codon:yes stop_codon:yes gene_type:complete